ncbi:MAG: lipid-A-disaccharide synthase [Bacteroidia bacterium]
MRMYIVVGELSAEMHVEPLVYELKRLIPDLALRGMGDELLAKAGVEVVFSYRPYSVVGFWAVFRSLPKYVKLFRLLLEDIRAYKPDGVLLVDFPGLNLRLAKRLKAQGYKVIYYIPPQIWAWNTQRAQTLQKSVDKLLVILPFEPAFYARFGIEAEYVGHPLVERLALYQPQALEVDVALLPGSRMHEVRRLAPVMAQVTSCFPARYAVAAVSHLPKKIYGPVSALPLYENRTYDLLSSAQAALVCSGTATLEAALWGVPSVVLYRGDFFSYRLAKTLIQVPYISLPNLILGRPVFPELIQRDAQPEKILRALQAILTDRESIRSQLHELRMRLGNQRASHQAAQAIAQALGIFVP